MAIVKVDKSTYTAETLYQWDKNQQLQIYGYFYQYSQT